MAAILGAIFENGSGPAVEQWSAAVGTLSERSRHELTEVRTGNLAIAFRGSAHKQHVDEAGITVLLDGYVDNIPRLITRFGLEPRAESVPASLSRLFKAAGEELFRHLSGEHVLSFIDHASGRVHLLRDRTGDRPLYFARVEGGWAWASECKMLMPLMQRRQLDAAGFGESMHYKMLIGDRTLFAGIGQLVTSCFAVVTADANEIVSTPYWQLRLNPVAPTETLEWWVDQTDAALRTVLARTIRPGSKVGVFLSGGVDSSLLARYVADVAPDCVLITPTWTDFNDQEVPRAREYARLLDREHRVLVYDQSKVAELFPYLVNRFEQPSRNFHALTLAAMVPDLAEFDSVIYGDAADTYFGPDGLRYLRNYQAKRNSIRPIAPVVRALAGLAPEYSNKARAVRKIAQWEVADLVRHYGRIEHSRFLTDRLHSMNLDVEPNRRITDLFYSKDQPTYEAFQTMAVYTAVVCHMETMDRLFVPADIDVITPFIAEELVELGIRLPVEYKLIDGGAKPVLKALAKRHFPAELVEAPKLGFPTPTVRWLSGPLADRVARLKTGKTAMSRVLGSDVIQALRMPDDYEAIWTLICMDELVDQFGLELPAF
jgi:asparagine synthase (glutamine-hydrolysing)